MSIYQEKTVIIIAGPTAVGKTGVAIRLAKHFNTEIISADSRQCYKELNIGVARPSDEELSQVKHHFIASHSVTDEINAAYFEKYALQKADEIFNKNPVAVMVGGTGLYIKAFCDGLDDIPDTDSAIRNGIRRQYEKKGLSWLQNEVKAKDPLFFKHGEIKNPQRLMRALEVMESTGSSVLEFRKGNKSKRDFNILKIGLELPKEELHRRINGRVDKMMEDGLLNEVIGLIPHKNLGALQTVGYKELFHYLDNKSTLEFAVEEIKKNTRQYAKRQMAWFRKDKEITWHSADAYASMIDSIESSMK